MAKDKSDTPAVRPDEAVEPVEEQGTTDVVGDYPERPYSEARIEDDGSTNRNYRPEEGEEPEAPQGAQDAPHPQGSPQDQPVPESAGEQRQGPDPATPA